MSSLYFIGALATMNIHPTGRHIALYIVLPLLVLYTPLIKRIALLGNIVIGVILGLVFVFTEAAINGVVDKMWIPFVLTATLSTIRELVKDVVDVAGDSMQGLKTFPKKYGLPSTLLYEL